METPATARLAASITDHSARVAVIGAGYVGLPLAVALAESGFTVTALDVDERKITSLRRGESYIQDVPSEKVSRLVGESRLAATSDYSILAATDIVFVCVPTPFDRMRTPDLGPVQSAAEGLAPYLHPGQLVILQSTTYPGTTEEFVMPILERGGLRAGVDFHLAFSPERIDPGNPRFTVANTPKVIGGLTPRCAELAADVLRPITPEVFVVSTPRAAEMTKLLENIFRSVNIALVNELALLCERMDIDIWEVIAAAKTKPFGFMPFYPGPGVGGHCIPVDPYYLAWKAREYDFFTKFIELAAETNEDMPHHVAQQVADTLARHGKPVGGARVLVLGVAFKKDVDDARNSPAERLIELLIGRSAQVFYHDPHVPTFKVGGSAFLRQPHQLTRIDLTEAALAAADVVVIVVGHSAYDWRWVTEHARLIVDTVNVTGGEPASKVVRLGAPQQQAAFVDAAASWGDGHVSSSSIIPQSSEAR
ncbi:MAG: nucleotide sugar dehydrogenase [Anaerolineae bacterium]